MASIYDHYTVIGSRAIIRFWPITTSTKAFAVECYVNDDASVTPA